MQLSHVKENSIKSSQNSIRSDLKDKVSSRSNTFGLSSNVEEFKLKSSFQSPFLKTNNSGFGTASSNKKVVEKKETMRTWNEDEFLIKEVTTILKYDDGTVEDFVEKHSLLRSDSFIKEGSV
jgi:hypothetical protein